MSYELHNFQNGETLNAEQINEMDAQIQANAEAIASVGELLDAINGEVV